MQCTFAKQRKRRGRFALCNAIAGAISVLAAGFEPGMAQSVSTAKIAVTCTGEKAVSADRLHVLCAGLHSALTAKYPGAQFVMTNDARPKANAFIALEALVSTPSNIEARLVWQAAGSAPVTGPRAGLSISDKDLTPSLQRKFLSRLVQDTALPF